MDSNTPGTCVGTKPFDNFCFRLRNQADIFQNQNQKYKKNSNKYIKHKYTSFFLFYRNLKCVSVYFLHKANCIFSNFRAVS